MRSEDMFLEKLCISLRFHSVTWQHFFKLEYAQLVSQAIKADHEAAEHFVCHPRLSTNHHCDERFQKLVIFVCWLAPNYKSIVTYFWKTNSSNGDYWGMRSSHQKKQSKLFNVLIFLKLFYHFSFQGCVLAKAEGSEHACMKSRVPFTVYKNFLLIFCIKQGHLNLLFS